jgi:ABC-type dipeptide/oligopeptide/nickel transport system permease subunit
MAAGGLTTLVITRDADALHVHPGLLLLIGLTVVLFAAMVGVMAVLKRSEDA